MTLFIPPRQITHPDRSARVPRMFRCAVCGQPLNECQAPTAHARQQYGWCDECWQATPCRHGSQA